MSLPSYLSSIKSSGIYRFVWDKSEIAGVDAEILRLVVGYSEVGPFNTPIYIKSETEFKKVFGPISKKLEKRGVFFHRMAIQALAAGPILALNLKKFNNETVKAANFDVVGEISLQDLNVEKIYDTTRFWKLDPDAMQAALGAGTDGKYISLTATSSKEASCTVLMRGYTPTGYDVTLATWFSTQNIEMPDYYADRANTLLSDYFAEIYVFKGEFTKSLAASDALAKYFTIDGDTIRLKPYITNAFGEKIDTLAALAADDASNFINVYRGILLPEFKDGQGVYISLDIVFNNDNAAHNMMMDFNTEYIEFAGIAALDTTCWNTTSSSVLSIKDFSINTVEVNYEDGSWVYGENDSCFDADLYKYNAIAGDADLKIGDVSGISLDPDPAVITHKVQDSGVTAGFNCYMKVNIPVDVAKDKMIVTIESDKIEAVDDVKLGSWTKPTSKNVNAYVFTIDGHKLSNTCPIAVPAGIYNFAIIAKKAGSYTITIDLGNGTTASFTETVADPYAKIGFEVGDRFVFTADGAAPEVVTLVDAETMAATKLDGTTVTLAAPFVKCNHKASEKCDGIILDGAYFEGYTYTSAKPASSKMMDKLTWQKNILKTLIDYEGIRLGLTNRVDIDYRYIVDTFEAFIDSNIHQELSIIAKEKDNAMALLNFPFIKSFMPSACDYASFVDDKGNFQTKYIALGGNKKKIAGITFSLPDEANGASHCAFFTGLLFSDGTVKSTAPAAALVSNKFMEKYTSRQPYYIVAGPNYSSLKYNELVGPDFNFSRADLDVLEPMGVNAIVYVPRLGTFVNSNQTAKQNPVTALSKVHVRELVIYLQDTIEKLLRQYQWDFNTPMLRDKIKEKADYICENIKNNGGIAVYENTCDESNNTDDVLNNEMLILSTSIEPGAGCGKMIHELTIYASGGMKSVIK